MKLIHCEINVDAATVKLRFDDGTEISIYTPRVDDELCPSVPMQTEIDWLFYNEPLTYAKLIFSGELKQYAKDMKGTHRIPTKKRWTTSRSCCPPFLHFNGLNRQSAIRSQIIKLLSERTVMATWVSKITISQAQQTVRMG